MVYHEGEKGMVVYKITNTLNGKIYIGQTLQPFNSRVNEHKKKMRNGTKHPLYDAMRKYGISAFSFEVIDTAIDADDLNKKEVYWIEHFNSMHPNGYNLTSGGAGTFDYHHTDDDKQRMSKLKNGVFDGSKNPFYGKHHSPEQIAKWKRERKGRMLTEEWKANISKTRKRVPIINIDTGEVFESARHAARHYGKDPDSGTPGTIAKVCQKIPKYNTCMGFHFEYYNPEIHDNTVPNLQFLKEGVTTIRKE